jgi:hypothetical protein
MRRHEEETEKNVPCGAGFPACLFQASEIGRLESLPHVRTDDGAGRIPALLFQVGFYKFNYIRGLGPRSEDLFYAACLELRHIFFRDDSATH